MSSQETVKSFKETLETWIVDQERKIEHGRKLIALLDKNTLKGGDIVFHPLYGNCIMGSLSKIDKEDGGFYDYDAEPKLYASIVFFDNVNSSINKMKVPLSELMPVNESTKNIYGN